MAGLLVVSMGDACRGKPTEDAMAMGFACREAAVPAMPSAPAAAGRVWPHAMSQQGKSLFPSAGAGPAGWRGCILQANYEAG